MIPNSELEEQAADDIAVEGANDGGQPSTNPESADDADDDNADPADNNESAEMEEVQEEAAEERKGGGYQ
jgi:hypothetical protein